MVNLVLGTASGDIDRYAKLALEILAGCTIDGKPVESSIFVRVNIEETNSVLERPAEHSSSSYIFNINLMYSTRTSIHKMYQKISPGW